jgi:Cu(I)/Ag(I) efflux system membrane fusion protein/cobalt-zinc-cadmium efflux system membrane fusion protein
LKQENKAMKRVGMVWIAVLIIGAGGFGWFEILKDEKKREWTPVLPSPAIAADEPLKAGMTDPKTGKKIKYWAAPMDPTYIRQEPGKSPMGMDLVPVYEEEGDGKEPASTIRIDPVTIQNMGIRTEKVKMGSPVKTIRTVGNIIYDETRIYTVNMKFNGWIEKLYVDFEGEQVRKGQPLFDIYSPELVTAQEEYLLALEQYRSLGQSGFEQVREAARRLRDASHTRLRYWDVSPAQIRRLESSGMVRKTVTVFSPATGVVTKKNAFQGHYVKAGEHQYEIADLSTVWVDVDIYEYELPWVEKGMPAEMELTYIPGKHFKGRVLFIYPYLNPKTRTATLRLEFPNPKGLLKPAMYSNVYLKSEIEEKSLLIPQEAVIDSGVRKVVFVSRGNGKFEPREVELGLEVNDDRYQILNGLSEGEEIVVSAQFMLDSESRLREVIQKMIEVKSEPPKSDAEDLDLSGISMEDDLDTSGMTMEDTLPEAAGK